MITKLNKLSYRQLLLLTGIISVLFSLLKLSSPDPLMVDGIVFLKAGQAFLASGWQASTQTYPWPFFSIFVSYISHYTGLNLLSTFHIIITFLQAMIAICFIALVKKLGGNTLEQRLAAIVILLYPFINNTRAFVTRDFGYWAFGLLAVIFLIEFMRHDKWRTALYWGIAMLTATLFRIEGFLMLAAAPLALLLRPNYNFLQRVKSFLVANSVLIFLVIVGIFVHSFHHHAGSNTRLMDYYQQATDILPKLIQHFQMDAQKIRVNILNPLSEENAMSILIGGLLVAYFLVVLKTMGIAYMILTCFGQLKNLIANKAGEAALLYILLFANEIMLIIFIFEQYFLATRYPVFMILIMMCWIPFSIRYIYQQWLNKKSGILGSKWLLALIAIALFINLVDSIFHFGYSKAYITYSGQWLYQNTAPQNHLFTNSKEVAFYASNSHQDPTRIANITLADNFDKLDACHYDWLALRVNKHGALSPSEQDFITHHDPIKTFENKRHDRVMIYQTKAWC